MSKGFRQMQVAYLIWHFRHEKENKHKHKSFSYSNKNSCNNEIIMTTKERYREMAATNLVFVYLPVLVLLL